MDIIDYPAEVQAAATQAFAVDARAGEAFMRLMECLDADSLTEDQIRSAYEAATTKNKEVT